MSITTLVIYYFLELFMLYIMFKCYSILSNKELNKAKLIHCLLFGFMIVINNMYINVSIRLLSSIILSIFINKIVFKSKLSESIKFTIIYFFISFLIELLLMLLFSILKIESIHLFNQEILIKIIFSITESIIVLKIISYNKLEILIKKLILFANKKKIYTKIVLILILFINIMTILLGENLDNNHIIILSFSSIVFIIITYKIIIEDKYNLLELKMYNENLKSSSKAYSKTIDECRELKHNLKNDLIGIKSFIPKEYHNEINELILKYNKRYEWISKIDDIPEGIQGVIYLKSNEAKKKHIKMYIDVKENIRNINKDYFELSSILGILLDNSIENSISSKAKVISVYINSSKNNLNIEIINTFSNKIDLDKLGNKDYSTKKEKSGIGLNYIKNLKKKNIKVK